MTQKQFQAAAAVTSAVAARWIEPLNAALNEFSITAPADIAMFIAQIGHESQSFSRVVENLNYQPGALKARFSRHRITEEQADKFGRTPAHPANQEAIANIIYGGDWGLENLGNKAPGDGWKYRGRGLPQITGLANYTGCGAALKLDLVNHPELLELDINAARAAAWFYTSKGCMAYGADVRRVTKIINGGLNGLDDRLDRYNKARAALLV
ncbi:glycoside hydrolase family 19 protein [Trabulsiella odontotermitis]|uniref:glycoside hydrolase family 19 protein n=1 Tax=Trabulsiella odontotermitis TaxID=379893 RepID=UPI003AD39AFE